MGVARLLAKGWVVFCLFASAHAVARAMGRGEILIESLQSVGLCVLLFGAMGLLFVAGFGASSGTGGGPLLARLRPHHLLPDFNEIVFLIFVALSFVNQVYVAPAIIGSAAAGAIDNAMQFVVPGHRALTAALGGCGLDGGRIFAGAFAWLLAIVYVASAVSRIGLTAGLLRLERTMRPSAFGPTLLAALYGLLAIVGFQLLYVGSAYPWLDCTAFAELGGAILIGLLPLLLAFLIVAALATLRASGPEPQ